MAHEVKMQHDHNYNHDTDPVKNRMLQILQEDKANGVFPVDCTEYISKIHKEITT
jgi:hypothetical protein